ncbi:radical SAM protein, partial [bacterium]|nr:radical SAM protein [bacterium]
MPLDANTALRLAGMRLQDRALIGPETVQIDLTDNCPNNCIGCWARSPFLRDDDHYDQLDQGEMSPQFALSLIPELAEQRVGGVFLAGGGDPSCYPYLIDVVRTVKEHGMHCTLNTSFVCTDEAQLDGLCDVGLDHMIVSVWAGNARTYSRLHPNQSPMTFDYVTRLLQRVAARKKAGLPAPTIKVYQVVCNLNYHEVGEMIQYARDVEAEEVELSIFDPIPRRTNQFNLSAEQIESLNDYFKDFEQTGRTFVHHELFLRRINNIDVLKGVFDNGIVASIPCAAGWFYSRVTAVGEVHACLKSHRIPTGNLYKKNEDFQRVFFGDYHNEFRRETIKIDHFNPYLQQIGHDIKFGLPGCFRVCDNIGHNQGVMRMEGGLTPDERAVVDRIVEMGKFGATKDEMITYAESQLPAWIDQSFTRIHRTDEVPDPEMAPGKWSGPRPPQVRADVPDKPGEPPPPPIREPNPDPPPVKEPPKGPPKPPPKEPPKASRPVATSDANAVTVAEPPSDEEWAAMAKLQYDGRKFISHVNRMAASGKGVAPTGPVVNTAAVAEERQASQEEIDASLRAAHESPVDSFHAALMDKPNGRVSVAEDTVVLAGDLDVLHNHLATQSGDMPTFADAMTALGKFNGHGRVRLPLSPDNVFRLDKIAARIETAAGRVIPGREKLYFDPEPVAMLPARLGPFLRNAATILKPAGVRLDADEERIRELLATFAKSEGHPVERLRALGVVANRAFVGPRTFHLDVTNACNTDCAPCWFHSPYAKDRPDAADFGPQWKKQMIDYDVFTRLVDDLAAMNAGEDVVLSGKGEPTTHPRIADMVRYLREKGLFSTLFTNGIRLNKDVREAVVDAQCDMVYVSLMSDTPETYLKLHSKAEPGEFEDVIANVKALVRLKKERKSDLPKIVLVNVLCTHNAHTVESFAKLGEEIGVDFLRYQLTAIESYNQPLKLS